LLRKVPAFADLADAQALDVGALLERAKQLADAERRAAIARVDALAGGLERPAWDGMMTWSELGELVGGGHEVGSHTLSHPILPRCSASEIEREVGESKRLLEKHLQCEVTSFAYPNGDFDARSLRAVEACGYRQAVSTRWGPNRRGAAPFALRRCDVVARHARDRRGLLSEARLAWRMSGLHPGLR
jgi:peptidoglycan/xylan/chitin deacetylase (PgdA/CDA1 family)